MYSMTNSKPDAYTAAIARREMRSFTIDRDRIKSQSGKDFYSTKLFLLDRWLRGE